jgi:porin
MSFFRKAKNMVCRKMFVCLVLLSFLEPATALHTGQPLWKRESLTEGFFGINDYLKDSGLEFGIALTSIYQQNVKGGISTHCARGRFSGSYDIEMLADLEKLLGFEKSSVYLLVEGGFPDAEGICESSVGSCWGINADAIGNEAAIVKELYYRRMFFDDRVELMIGKMDLTGYFDAIEYANDEVTQFLNSAFVDNPAIAFPDYSLAIMVTVDVTDDLYLMGSIADALAERGRTGFQTAFNGKDYYFYILEAGLKNKFDSLKGPLAGTYRLGVWNDPRPKANSDLADTGKSYRDDVGFYLSCDQLVFKESSDREDSQGLGLFFRYGWAEERRNDITDFWSAGFQYQGLIDGRDEDVLGFAFGQGFFSDEAHESYTADYEGAFETYYSVRIAQWFVLSPSIQYIANPGGDRDVSDAVIVGGRVVVIF